MSVARKLFRFFFYDFAIKRSWKLRYQKLASETAAEKFYFMNYGYDYVDKEDRPQLDREDETYRYSIQLYNHLAKKSVLLNKDILEVGCGRGGGCYFIKKYHKPQTVTGIDLSTNAIKIAKEQFSHLNIEFKEGDATALPLLKESYDAVINVESSHCYPNVRKFVQEVKRVLKKNGHFLIADFGTADRMKALEQIFTETGFKIANTEDITENVLLSLTELSRYYTNVFSKTSSDDERKNSLLQMARVKGTPGFDYFVNRKEIYKSYLLTF